VLLFKVTSSGVRLLPRHIPQPSWVYNRDQIKRARRLYLETGLQTFGVTSSTHTEGRERERRRRGKRREKKGERPLAADSSFFFPLRAVVVCFV